MKTLLAIIWQRYRLWRSRCRCDSTDLELLVGSRIRCNDCGTRYNQLSELRRR